MTPINLNKYEATIQRGQAERAILFIDLVGSTEYKQLVPDHTWIPRQLAFLNELYDSVAMEHKEIIDHHAFIGDEIMFSLSNPSRALSVLDCVRAAVDKLNEFFVEDRDKVRIKVGAHSGPVYLDVHRQNNPLGNTIDIAARVAKEARTGQILMSQAVVESATGKPVNNLSGGSMDRFVPFGIRRFKGVQGEMLIFQLASTVETSPETQADEAETNETRSLQNLLVDIIEHEARLHSVVKLKLATLKEEPMVRRFLKRVRGSDEEAVRLLLWSLENCGAIGAFEFVNGELTIHS